MEHEFYSCLLRTRTSIKHLLKYNFARTLGCFDELVSLLGNDTQQPEARIALRNVAGTRGRITLLGTKRMSPRSSLNSSDLAYIVNADYGNCIDRCAGSLLNDADPKRIPKK